jgi:hypothetical protein
VQLKAERSSVDIDQVDHDERELRRLRAEAREQLEEAEAVALELAAATRSLRDALLDEGRLGHELRIDLAGTTLVGRAEHVGASVLRLMSADGTRRTISIPAIDGVLVDRRDSSASLVSVGYPETVEACLREWVQVGAVVEIARRTSPAVIGVLRAVTPTHVELAQDDGRAVLVPHTAVAWARRP